jgi:hypothetical protein
LTKIVDTHICIPVGSTSPWANRAWLRYRNNETNYTSQNDSHLNHDALMRDFRRVISEGNERRN